MKKAAVFFLTALLFFSPVFLFPGLGSNKGAETFLLEEETPICLSFENYQRKEGWTPVVLSFGELNCLLWMDASGRVSERRETGAHFVEPVCIIDELAQSLGHDANTLYFEVYEQNEVRTRWKLSPGGSPGTARTAGTVAKKILFRESGIELDLGNLRLRLNHTAWEFREFSPGLFQVQFHGPVMEVHQKLVYEKAAGIIYSTQERNNRLIPGTSRTWAIKTQESGSQISGGN